MSEESRKHNSHAAESWRELAGDVRQWADGHRLAITATVALVVLNLVVWLVVAMAGFAFPLRLDTSMAEFDFGKLFCTLFLARGVIQLILDAALWLVMLSIAEPWLGRARTVGTALACALGGVIVGLILCAAAGWLFQDSQFVSRMQFALSPLVLPVGALMAASAFCSRNFVGTPRGKVRRSGPAAQGRVSTCYSLAAPVPAQLDVVPHGELGLDVRRRITYRLMWNNPTGNLISWFTGSVPGDSGPNPIPNA